MSDTSRTAVLSRLLECPRDIEDLAAEVRMLPWDCEEPLVRLTRAHLNEILERFLVGELTTEHVKRWARLVECRSDIEVEDGRFGVPREVIHELANPYLTEPLTKESALRMQNELATQTI